MESRAEPAGSVGLVDALVQLSFAIQDILTRASASHHLSVSQLRLIGILRDRTPPMTAIADHLGLDRSSVTGLVDRGEQRGLVSRTVSSEDARVTLVSLTPLGFDVGSRIAAAVTTEIEALVRRVPGADREHVVRFASAVLDARVEEVATVTGRTPPHWR